jgi:hypothetical protein
MIALLFFLDATTRTGLPNIPQRSLVIAKERKRTEQNRKGRRRNNIDHRAFYVESFKPGDATMVAEGPDSHPQTLCLPNGSVCLTWVCYTSNYEGFKIKIVWRDDGILQLRGFSPNLSHSLLPLVSVSIE